MTLREEILSRSGILNEASESEFDTFAVSKKFSDALRHHEYANGFEEKVIDAILDNNKDITVPYFTRARQCITFLGQIAEAIKKEQELISEKISEAEKEISK